MADEEQVLSVMERAVTLAAENLDSMRLAEGEKLSQDLLMRGETVRSIVAAIDERAPMVVTEYKDKMYARIRELLEDGVDIPEERILTEAAVFADKSNITEELSGSTVT